jgi:DNA-binding response OmpR family regulator
VKVETDLALGNKNDSRSKAQKGPIRRALVVENDLEMSALIEEVLGSIAIEVVTPAKNIDTEPHFNKEKFDAVLIGLSTFPENDVELIRRRRSFLSVPTNVLARSRWVLRLAPHSSSTSPSIACA